jgi:hypothetical protein
MIDNTFSYALRWAVASGAEENDVRGAWVTGRAVDVPIGPTWEVLRATTTVGRDVIRHLRARRVPLGPTLWVPPRATVEFVLPSGACAEWQPHRSAVGRVVKVVSEGTIRWPAPDVTDAADRQAACGRRWIVPPRLTGEPHTPIRPLAEAIAYTLAHHNAAAEAARQAVNHAAPTR